MRPLCFLASSLALILAGCAVEPVEPADPATPLPTPGTSPSTIPAATATPTADAPARVLVNDVFDGSGTNEVAWSAGLWNASVRPDLRRAHLDGVVEETPSGVRMVAAAAKEGNVSLPYQGYMRAIAVTTDAVTVEATVTPHTLYRWGVVLGGDEEWVHAQVDAGEFSLAGTADIPWDVEYVHRPAPEAGRTYDVRLTLREDGTASATFYGKQGEILARATARGYHLSPAEVKFVGFGVWVDDATSPLSDYTTSSIRVTQA